MAASPRTQGHPEGLPPPPAVFTDAAETDDVHLVSESPAGRLLRPVSAGICLCDQYELHLELPVLRCSVWTVVLPDPGQKWVFLVSYGRKMIGASPGLSRPLAETAFGCAISLL